MNTTDTRKYIVFRWIAGGAKHYNPGLRPMTHRQALTFRTKMTHPAQWGLEEVTDNTAEKMRRTAEARGVEIDPCWLETVGA
jgi:hypothetical protein